MTGWNAQKRGLSFVLPLLDASTQDIVAEELSEEHLSSGIGEGKKGVHVSMFVSISRVPQQPPTPLICSARMGRR